MRILLGDDPSKTEQIRSLLVPEVRERLIMFLRANADIFAWIAIDLPGIPSDVIILKLSVDPLYPLSSKKKEVLLQRQKAIEEEVDKLVKVGFIRKTIQIR